MILSAALRATLLRVSARKGLSFLTISTRVSEEIILHGLRGGDVSQEVSDNMARWTREFVEEPVTGQHCPTCGALPRKHHQEGCSMAKPAVVPK